MYINKPPRGDDFRRLNVPFEMLRCYAQQIPNKTIKINPGSFFKNWNNLVEFSGGTTKQITFPLTYARWDVVTLTGSGLIEIISGVESSNPEVNMSIPVDSLPLCLIYIEASDTVITNNMIMDIRPLFSTGIYSQEHNILISRTASDCHPVTAITGLTAMLADRPTTSDVNLLLNNKADITGTVNTDFMLNIDETGVPASNVSLSIGRGNEPTVSIRYNETSDIFQFTNDGTLWHNFRAIYDNFSAIIDPTVSDDNLLNYTIGSQWINTLTGDVFMCVNSSTASAIWKKLN